MNPSYQFTPYTLPMVATALFAVILTIYGWRHRTVPGALPFAALMALELLWVISAALEAAALDEPAKIFWFQAQYFWQGPIIVAGLYFVLEYAHLDRFLNPLTLSAMSIFILLGSGLIITNDVHHWIWISFSLDGDIQAVRGMGHLILSLSGLLVAIATLPILLWLFIRSTQHRLPATAIFCGQLAVRTAYLFGLADLEPFAPFDFTLLAVNFSALMYAIALFGFRIFDPVPMARRIVIEQMSEGMLVLDTQDQIVDLNPAAEKILGISKSRACGCQVNKVLPISPNPTARLADPNATQSLWDAWRAEITLGSDNAVRYYALHLSSLKEQRGLTIGSLILLHDVTEQTHARAQLLEQQRALAMADERERLARELHDSVGQVLAYTSLELETARQLLEQGQTANVNGQLGRLARIIQNTHADVREQILNLRVAPSTEQSLVTTLKEYLDGYTQNYGVVTDLVLGGALDGGAFKPEAQMQLFRIIQEALSNARKHGNARRVQIKFGIEDNLACVTIQDDGGGFDPTQENDTEKKHFGLQFMRERAEHLGGGLVVDSMPGKGTRVVVKVPVKQ